MIGCLPKQPIIVLYFEFESALKFYNLKAWNLYHQVPHLTQDTTYESDKTTIKHHTQDRQEASHFPAGAYEAAMNRQESMTNKKHK